MTRKASSSVNAEQLNMVARSYNTLQYHPQLLDWLTVLKPDKDYSTFTKFRLHKELNDILLQFHGGEFAYKYALFTKYANKKLVGAFEMNVNNSRADFVTVNGLTSSFEIKTHKDNLCKLEKQSNDYLSTFEFNHIVIDECHLEKAKDVLPKNYGIILFEGKIKRTYRKAGISIQLEPTFQLNQLSKKEIQRTFGCSDRTGVLKKYSKKDINAGFKEILKRRYSKRWNFIVQHSNRILPIDIQYFFSSNISPKLIYK